MAQSRSTPVARKFLWLGGATALLACGRAPLLLAPAAALPAIEPAAIESTLFLIGDAGGVKAGGDRVMRELIRQARAAPRTSAIVFLGDNIYPAGLPRPGDAEYREARRRLLTQASVADSTGLPVYFVPGNHDWDRQGRNGWAAVQRSGALLQDYARDHNVRVAQLPAGGCPGPEVVAVGGDLRMVFVDTQWWLHAHARPGRSTEEARRALPDPDVRCAITSEPALLDSLTSIFRAGGTTVDVMVGHHPFESHGDHGGYHPWLQWILPATPTPIAPWVWLPVGWIYPLARRMVANSQDQFSEANRAMVHALEGTFQPGRPFVYASGHEHTLEVIRRGADRYYLVSGSGYEDHQSSVGRGDSTAFAASRPGFMRLDVLPPGSVRIGVTIIDKRNQAKEAYQAWLRQ